MITTEARRRRARTTAWVFVLAGLLLGAIQLASPSAGAQTTVTIAARDIVIDDVNGAVNIVLDLQPGAQAPAGIEFSLAYDPTIIRPVLNEDPNAGLLGVPLCTLIAPAGLVTCGPPNPDDFIRIAIFRNAGGWTGDQELISFPFVAQGIEGTSGVSLTITEITNSGGIPLGTNAIDGSVTVEVPVPTPTVTPIPEPTATSTPIPEPDSADLTVSKSVAPAGPVDVGATVTYQITGTNAGPDAASAVVVDDTLPDGITISTLPTNADWNCIETSTQLVCNLLGDMAFNQNFTLEYTAVVETDAALGATLLNTVEIQSSTIDPVPGNNSAQAPLLIAEPTATPTLVPEPTATLVPEPTATLVPDPTPTLVPEPTATLVPEPTATLVPEPTATLVPEPTATLVPEPTATLVPEPTATLVPEPTATLVPDATPTVVADPTATLVPEPTATLVPEATSTATPVPATPTATATATAVPAAPTSTPGTVNSGGTTSSPALAYPGPFNNAPPSGGSTSGTGADSAPAGSGTGGSSTSGSASTGASTGSTAGPGTVASTGQSQGDSPLAVTGTENMLMASLSILLLSAGGVLMVASRRKDDEF